jgi:hypothetical protein
VYPSQPPQVRWRPEVLRSMRRCRQMRVNERIDRVSLLRVLPGVCRPGLPRQRPALTPGPAERSGAALI